MTSFPPGELISQFYPAAGTVMVLPRHLDEAGTYEAADEEQPEEEHHGALKRPGHRRRQYIPSSTARNCTPVIVTYHSSGLALPRFLCHTTARSVAISRSRSVSCTQPARSISRQFLTSMTTPGDRKYPLGHAIPDRPAAPHSGSRGYAMSRQRQTQRPCLSFSRNSCMSSLAADAGEPGLPSCLRGRAPRRAPGVAGLDLGCLEGRGPAPGELALEAAPAGGVSVLGDSSTVRIFTAAPSRVPFGELDYQLIDATISHPNAGFEQRDFGAAGR